MGDVASSRRTENGRINQTGRPFTGLNSLESRRGFYTNTQTGTIIVWVLLLLLGDINGE